MPGKNRHRPHDDAHVGKPWDRVKRRGPRTCERTLLDHLLTEDECQANIEFGGYRSPMALVLDDGFVRVNYTHDANRSWLFGRAV